MLKEALSDVLSKDELNALYAGFDVIGDIAVIKIPDSLLARKKVIGEAIFQNVKQVKVVLMQKGSVSGEYRTRDLELIAGENRTETIYREHGCTFFVNVARAYFSPRLSTERMRIAKLVKEGERVLNMFAGVGIYSAIIAKVQPKSEVVSIEINPEAHKYAIENAKINKVNQRVGTILGDAKEIIRTQSIGRFHRILMPLPESAFEYLDDAISVLNPSGWIHYYLHVHAHSKDDAIAEAVNDLQGRLDKRGENKTIKVVREVGPRWFQIVADIHF